MNSDRITALENAMRRVVPHGRGLADDDGQTRRTGQLWTTKPEPGFPAWLPSDCRSDEPLPVVLLATNTREMGGHALHLAAPVLLSTEHAGPEDVILPRSVLAYRPAVAVGSCFSLLDDSLEECKGSLPEKTTEAILGFRRFLRGLADACPKVVTGPDYIDEMDIRYQLHENLVDRIDYLQLPLLKWAEECGVLEAEQELLVAAASPARAIPDPHMIEWPLPDTQLAYAASEVDRTRPLQTRRYAGVEANVSVAVSECEQPGQFALEVVDDPAGILDKARIIDTTEQVLAEIRSGTANFRCPSDGRFRLISSDGKEIELKLVHESTDEPS